MQANAVAILESRRGLSWRDIPSVVLNVGGVGRRSFLIDSGFAGTGYVDRRLTAELLAGGYAAPLDLIVESFDVLGSRRTADLAVAKVSIGEFSHAGLHFTEGDANMIGLHHLSRYIVTFDFPRGNMYLKPVAVSTNLTVVTSAALRLLAATA